MSPLRVDDVPGSSELGEYERSEVERSPQGGSGKWDHSRDHRRFWACSVFGASASAGHLRDSRTSKSLTITEALECMSFKNAVRPVHPAGSICRRYMTCALPRQRMQAGSTGKLHPSRVPLPEAQSA